MLTSRYGIGRKYDGAANASDCQSGRRNNCRSTSAGCAHTTTAAVILPENAVDAGSEIVAAGGHTPAVTSLPPAANVRIAYARMAPCLRGAMMICLHADIWSIGHAAMSVCPY
jgi:hypothetical protein